MRFLALILILTAFCSFRPSYETTVYGQLISRSHKNKVSARYVFVRYCGQNLAGINTDSQGRFQLFFNVGYGIDSPMRFYYVRHTDTVLLKTIYTFTKSEFKKDEDQAFNVPFYIP